MFSPSGPLRFLIVALTFGLANLPAASHAYISASGNFQTGTPAPSLTITAPISLTISNPGNVSNPSIIRLVFDEWAVSVDSARGIPAADGNQFSYYRLDNGSVQRSQIIDLIDSYGANDSSITAYDGWCTFLPISVTVGQTITFLPITNFYSANANFVPPPAVFEGQVFVTDGNGNRLSFNSSVGAVPEPSTWALLGVGAGLLCASVLRWRAA